MNPSGFVYFIITEKPKTPTHIKPGSMCYIRAYKYRSEVSTRGSLKRLSVELLDSHCRLPYDIDKACMQKLNADEADLLLACQPELDRLNLFRNTDAVQTALTLTVGTEVMVEEDGEKLRGIIRYIGPMDDPNYSHLITGRYFGVELQGADKGKGSTNGTFRSKKCFSCEKNCGVFAPFCRVRPVVPTSHSPSMSMHHTQQETEGIIPGDSVMFVINDEFRFGMVVDIQEEAGTPMVRISTCAEFLSYGNSYQVDKCWQQLNAHQGKEWLRQEKEELQGVTLLDAHMHACMHNSLKAQVTACDLQLEVSNLLGYSRPTRVAECQRLTSLLRTVND